MLKNFTPNQKMLAKMMSEISEKCYCAGWMENLEYVLWSTFKTGEREYGQDIITKSEIENLKQLSEITSCWIYFDDVKGQTPILLIHWETKYNEHLIQNPDIING